MGAQSRTPLKPPKPSQHYRIEGFKGRWSLGTMGVFYTVLMLHTDKSFRKFIKSNRNRIVFTILRLIWNITDVRLVPNQSEYDNYNLILV